jgi:integrase
VEYFVLEDGEKKRKRVSGGGPWGIVGSGNRLRSVKERTRYFEGLAKAVARKFDEAETAGEGLAASVAAALDEKARRVSPETMAVLRGVSRRFLAAMGDVPVRRVTTGQVRDFLNAQPGKNSVWNNNRRDLHSLWGVMVELGYATENPVSKLKRRKSAPTWNEAYDGGQILAVMAACEGNGRNMGLCARLMFHAFLRPHQEVRRLQRKHVDFSRNLITVPAALRKASDVFVVPMHPQLRSALVLAGVDALSADDYVIYAEAPSKCVGRDYFRVLWKRMRPGLLASGTIRAGQTLYSIRHTAACTFYEAHKDVERLQRVMGHRDMASTITYLRSMGKLSPVMDPCMMPNL